MSPSEASEPQPLTDRIADARVDKHLSRQQSHLHRLFPHEVHERTVPDDRAGYA